MKTKVHEVAKVLHTHTHTHICRYYIHLETKKGAKLEQKINKMEYINLAKGKNLLARFCAFEKL